MQIIKENDLEKIAIDLIKKISKTKAKGATVVALRGDLGSGKTTLTQHLCNELGIKNKIISPTFVIMKKYPIQSEKFKSLIHIDAYRLNKKEEMVHLGWNEILSNNENIIIVEWPENIKELIPGNAIKIELSHIDEKTRGIAIEID